MSTNWRIPSPQLEVISYFKIKKEYQILECCTKAQTLGTGTTRVSMCDRITVYQPVLYLQYFIYNNVKSQDIIFDFYRSILIPLVFRNSTI